jgi:hypothetical protein
LENAEAKHASPVLAAKLPMPLRVPPPEFDEQFDEQFDEH